MRRKVADRAQWRFQSVMAFDSFASPKNASFVGRCPIGCSILDTPRDQGGSVKGQRTG